MTLTLQPRSESEAIDAVNSAVREGRALHIRGGGTRSGLGRPADARSTPISTTALTGIILYEPAELVMSARAGTPLEEIEAELAAHQQVLPFEPLDHRSVLGTKGTPTIGGVFASNASGPRRLSAGAARDFCLGVRFINGRAQAISSGGRVMKNVTGLDLVKLQCGAMGTLGLLTEVTFKVLPAPRGTINLSITGLNAGEAIDAMAAAMMSPYEVAAAGFRDDSLVLRLEGFENSVTYRASQLKTLLGKFGAVSEIDPDLSLRFWTQLPVPTGHDPTTHELWRVSLPASKSTLLLSALSVVPNATVTLDWAGGLVWIALQMGSRIDLHRVAAAARGTATLIRASDERRTTGPIFQPLGPAALVVAQRVKASIDPTGVFNPGRMYQDV